MPKGSDWNCIGKFIVFDTPDGLSGGIIIIAAADNAPVKVHDWMPVLCKTGVIWAPVCTNHENEHSARYLRCLADHHALLTVTSLTSSTWTALM